MKITGKDLIKIGYAESKLLGELLAVLNKNFAHLRKKKILKMAKELLAQPGKFQQNTSLSSIADTLLNPPVDETIHLHEEALPYQVYGAAGIEAGASQQMETAMRLPVTVGGALMPDAHQGYGLPIGGVLATKNSVIPYGVGMDIGCRMCMSIFSISPDTLAEKKENLKKILTDNTRFGYATFKRPKDHKVLTNPLFKEISLLKTLKSKAREQIGTSGGGNHFVEFGITDILEDGNELGLPKGKYLALLSHSGSRGFGAQIARHYTKLATQICKLPKEARHLAWLDLDSELGREYWLAMNLAGDYASACHHQIHTRIATTLGENPLKMVENHHNFAWKEQDVFGNDIIVHRKGATPAGKGVLGIIPGSMTAPGFIVRGKGERTSLNSAAHGAGRRMSRTRAKKELDPSAVARFLQNAGVEVIGSGLDESPQAYKDIHQVMAAQADLVEILASFQPKIVRMCGDQNL